LGKSISRKIAEFTQSLNYEEIPAEVIYTAKKFLYDSLGCAYGGLQTKDVNIVYNIYKNIGGSAQATVIGLGEMLPAINTTFINSLAIRALDFNDIYWREDPSHPSDLIPAALSAGEMVNATMKEVLTAIVLAYEFEQRLCEFAVPGIRERKWHHATLTQFVSPLVAGKLLKLNTDQLVNAIGINASHNYTVGAPTAGKLTMMKNTVDPMAVQAGVMAALLAKEGYSGTELIFEGKEGFMDTFFGWNAIENKPQPIKMEGRNQNTKWTWDVEKLTNNFGDNYKILECGMKAFPTEALTHTHISAVLEVMKRNKINYEDIQEIKITTIARAVDILFDPNKYNPTSRETADHSLPFCIAAAVIDGKITTETFTEEKLQNSDIRNIITKIKGEASDDFEKLFPEKQPSRATIILKDGRTYSHYLEYPKGDPRNPMTEEELELKFNSLSKNFLTETKQKEIKNIIFNAEEFSAREFMQKLKADKYVNSII